jgi:hypothetical protein
MKKKQGHPTKSIIIKRADVDIEMIPLVNWLNSFESVTTLYCCQGEDGETEDDIIEDSFDKPYVMWTCIDTSDLMYILTELKYNGVTEIYWDINKRCFIYRTEFPNKQALVNLKI